MENAWVTELLVRMDCNGCVHKVRKAVHGLEGVYETRVDFGAQMITVIGKATPEQIVRAIRKGARKSAAVHSHNGPPDDQPPPSADEAPPAAPEPEAAAPPPAEEAAPPAPPAEAPPPAENPNPEPPAQQPDAAEEKPMVHMYPYHDLNRGHYWHGYVDHASLVTSPVPYYISNAVHSYNTYTPPPSQPLYHVVEQGHNHFPVQPVDQRHDSGYYHVDYHYQRSQGGDRMGAMFSDENPNACRIC